MKELFSVDRAVTYIRSHNSGIRDSAGIEISGWLVHYETQHISLDDVMEKLTRVSEVLRIVQWEPGSLFVIRKPPNPPITVLEPHPRELADLRTVSGRHQ